jgi:hypothetical protein
MGGVVPCLSACLPGVLLVVGRVGWARPGASWGHWLGCAATPEARQLGSGRASRVACVRGAYPWYTSWVSIVGAGEASSHPVESSHAMRFAHVGLAL